MPVTTIRITAEDTVCEELTAVSTSKHNRNADTPAIPGRPRNREKAGNLAPNAKTKAGGRTRHPGAGMTNTMNAQRATPVAISSAVAARSAGLLGEPTTRTGEERAPNR